MALSSDDLPHHPPEGTWVVYNYDYNAYPVAHFKTEKAAYEFAGRRGCSDRVRFWEFGKEWSV